MIHTDTIVMKVKGKGAWEGWTGLLGTNMLALYSRGTPELHLHLICTRGTGKNCMQIKELKWCKYFRREQIRKRRNISSFRSHRLFTLFSIQHNHLICGLRNSKQFKIYCYLTKEWKEERETQCSLWQFSGNERKCSPRLPDSIPV